MAAPTSLTEKPKRVKQPNGFGSVPALFCFLFVLQLCLLACCFVRENAALVKASRQSQIDLAALDHAKAFAWENHRIRMCGGDPDTSRTITIGSHEIQLQDQISSVLIKDGTRLLQLYIEEGKAAGLKGGT